MQKPIVTIRSIPSARSASTPTAMSDAIAGHDVRSTCVMWSNDSSRTSVAAVRPNQSIATASMPCSAKRRASSS